MSARPQRLNRNHGGYHGETIDIAAVLTAFAGAARKANWVLEDIPAAPGLNLLAARRAPAAIAQPDGALRVYLSTGIHGDEPAGPLALLQLLEADAWPRDLDLWALPCLNPTGFPLNRRENAAGVDLNRDYRHLQTDEVRAHVAWLARQPAFDVTLCLHEDWEAQGFYVYELNPDDRLSLSPRMVEAVARVCPLDLSPVIEGRDARGGIIRPNQDPTSRPQWPEAFYLIRNKTRLSYTLEAPSDFPLATRVPALVAGVNAALDGVWSQTARAVLSRTCVRGV
jgi:hypothetical protein